MRKNFKNFFMIGETWLIMCLKPFLPEAFDKTLKKGKDDIKTSFSLTLTLVGK